MMRRSSNKTYVVLHNLWRIALDHKAQCHDPECSISLHLVKEAAQDLLKKDTTLSSEEALDVEGWFALWPH
jgi:hypothetical protein